jgi:ComF family protein
MLAGIGRACGAVLDLIYPPDCVACGAALEGREEGGLCLACGAGLPWIGEWRCPRCGDELGPYAEGARACPSACTKKVLIFRGAAAVCRYEGAAREMVHRLKYGGDPRPADWMGRRMRDVLDRTDWFAECDLIVPVPLHWRRRLARRFNQAEMLARGITRAAGRDAPVNALRRLRRTPPQSFLDYEARTENVKRAFAVRSAERVSGKVVLIVDDVMTTCATAAECARTLLAAGAKRVHVAVFAR